MANEPVSRPDPVGKGLYLPELFMMTIENAREQRYSPERFVVEFLRVQDGLTLMCQPCRALLPLKIFTIADAEKFHELASRGRVDELRDEVVDRYGEYKSICPLCRTRRLLPLFLPPIYLIDRPDDENGNGGLAAGEAA